MSYSKSLAKLPATVVAIAAAVSLGITSQARAVTTYRVQVTCPIDGQQFTTTMMSSYFQSGVRLDSKPVGSVIAPYPLPVCPGNGFVMYKSDFSNAEIDALRLIVSSTEFVRLRGENTDYYMAAYVAERVGSSDYELGNMYVKASWEAERDRSQLVDQYRSLALAKLDAFVKEETDRSNDWWVASVLAAEMDRLLGHFDAVEARFNTLPVAELLELFPETNLMEVLEQIRTHARNHNAEPENMHAPEYERFMGFAH